MARGILGVDYTNFVSAFFSVPSISNVFIMSPKYKPTIGYRILHTFNFFRKLGQFVKKYSVFVFISPPYFHFPSLFILKILRKRVVIVVVDMYGEMALEKMWQAPLHKKILRRLLFPVYELMESASIKLSDAVFCSPSYSIIKYKSRKLNENVYRVRNGANVEKISRIKPKTYDRKTIFYMGGFPRWKGIDLLLKAFETVKKKHDEVQLVLVGGCEEEIRYDQELRKLLDGSKDVVLIGYSPHQEAISYLKGAKIAVMPAHDSFVTRSLSSLKVFEYIAAEVPQVCTDTGEHAYWVRKLGVGIVVKDTQDAIAMGVLTLLENEEMYKKIKENCKKRKWEIDHKVLWGPYLSYLSNVRSQVQAHNKKMINRF
jgi:glycosyltransferase involved in cell wall biosynthesis